MKKIFLPFLYFSLACLSVANYSCKNRSNTVTTTDTATITPVVPDNTVQKAPDTAVVVSPDETLKSNLVDATKDFPGVTATVDQGVVTLTGNITRAKLPMLMQAVNGLHPKKVNNNLTIK